MQCFLVKKIERKFQVLGKIHMAFIDQFVGQFNEEQKQMELDLLDRKIMYLLSRNARFSESSIAKALKISKEVVHYRIKRLQKKGFLHGFITVLDEEKLGLSVYRINLTLYPSYSFQRLLDSLLADSRVTNVIHLNSRLDIQLTATTSDAREFDRFFDTFLHEHHTLIKDYTISTFLEEHYLGLDFLLENTAEQPHISERKGSAFQREFAERKRDQYSLKLDEKDHQILNKIVMNSRLPILQLSQSLGLAPTSVKKRLSTMVTAGVIKHFIPYASFSFLGYHWYFLHLRTKNVKQPSFLEFLRQHPNIIWLSRHMGKWNYHLSIFTRNNTEFNQVVQEVQGHLGDSLIDYSSSTVFKQYKYRPRVT